MVTGVSDVLFCDRVYFLLNNPAYSSCLGINLLFDLWYLLLRAAPGLRNEAVARVIIQRLNDGDLMNLRLDHA